MPERENRVVILLHSGAYDRVQYALSIAMVALASGMEVITLWTYGALLRLVKGRIDELGEETPPSIRAALERGLAKGGVETISEALTEAKRLGLKVYACPSAMATVNVIRSELIPEVDSTEGLASFLEQAKAAAVTLYI